MPLFKPKPVEAVQFTEAMARGDEPLPRGVLMNMRQKNAQGEMTYHHHIAVNVRPNSVVSVEIGNWIVYCAADEEGRNFIAAVLTAAEFEGMYEAV